MFYYSKYNWLYLMNLFFSLFMVLNMNTFYSMWIFMEYNLLIFVTLAILIDFKVGDKILKYYLLNSFSSMIFLMMINLMMLSFFKSEYFLIIMNMMMMIKLGIFPFHLWFIDLMMCFNWLNCFFLSTFQKLIPLIILINMYNYYYIIIVSIINGMFSIMMIFNQILMKKLLGYSSINHLSWMLISLLISFKLMFIYYLSYLLINYSLMKFLNDFMLNELSDLFFFVSMNNNKFYLFFIFLSLGGIPPFFGFLMKWMMILDLNNFGFYFMLIILILYSLVFLYYYLRLSFNILMFNYYSINNLLVKFFLIYYNKNYSFSLFMMNFSLINLLILFFWLIN